ncbi:hypothetical protein LTR50_000610 [Elasticomyces elasticus]|nr:hypothetical protein LTR50_000610 [Elasticomyces elasticus]
MNCLADDDEALRTTAMGAMYNVCFEYAMMPQLRCGTAGMTRSNRTSVSPVTDIAAQLLGDLVEYGIKTADDGGATMFGLLNPSERSQLAIDTVALLEGLIDGTTARNASVDEQEQENSANLFATLLQLLGLPRLQDSILEEKLLNRVWTVFVRSVESGSHLTEDPKHTLHTFTSILCEICALPLCFSLYVSKDATLAQVVDCLYATLKRGPPASSKESRTAACLMLGNLVRGGDLASETALAMRMLKYEKVGLISVWLESRVLSSIEIMKIREHFFHMDGLDNRQHCVENNFA